MSISSKNNVKNDKLEEMSAAAGGAMAFSAKKADDTTNETKLREMIRKSIRLYSKQKNKPKKENVQEQKLRNIIRKLISEAKESSLAQPSSTLEGILRSFFNTSGIYETVRDKFYLFQTHEDEKIGFITAFLERSNEVLMTPSVEDEEQQESPESDLKEEEDENETREDNILKKWNAFVPPEIEKEKITIKKKKEAAKKQAAKEPEDTEFENYRERGSSAARDVLEKRVQSELVKILSQLIGDEKEEARISIMQNFAAWFDMWTEDTEEITQILADCLEQNQVPVPKQLQPAPTMDTGSSEEDVVPNPEDGEDIVAGDSNSEEDDLMELLDSDLS